MEVLSPKKLESWDHT